MVDACRGFQGQAAYELDLFLLKLGVDAARGRLLEFHEQCAADGFTADLPAFEVAPADVGDHVPSNGLSPGGYQVGVTPEALLDLRQAVLPRLGVPLYQGVDLP